MKRFFFSLLLSSLLFGCSTPESLQNFDSDKWIADRMGCNGNRADLIDDLEALRDDLYGKKEYILRNLLGKPDQEILLERSERIYYYYIESGTQCTGTKGISEANRVEIRFNSLAKVKEITYNEPLNSRKPE